MLKLLLMIVIDDRYFRPRYIHYSKNYYRALLGDEIRYTKLYEDYQQLKLRWSNWRWWIVNYSSHREERFRWQKQN